MITLVELFYDVSFEHLNIDLHLRITQESTGAYFQWGHYYNNNHAKYTI